MDVAIAAAPVNIMPLLDDGDFKTRETSVAYNAAGMDLVWNFVTPAGAYTQTAVTPTTSGVYDWTHKGDGMYSIEIPASGGGSINNDTEGVGWFTGVATGVLPWRGPTIGFRAAGLNDKLIESAYDTTRGLAGTALPAAAAEAAGGLYTRGTGAGQINQANNGQIDANAARLGGTTQTGRDIGASVLLSSGTGTGQISLTSGIAAVNVTQYGGSNGTFSSGRPEVNTTHAAGTAWNSGAIGAATLASDTIAAAKIATGAITSAKFAAGAIDAAAVAADAIGASELATDACTEIANSIWNRLTSGITTASSIGKLLVDNIDATISSRASQTTVDDIPTNSELATALAAADDAVLAAVGGVETKVDTGNAVLDKLDDTLEDDGGTYRFTANALEEAPAGGGGGGITVDDILDEPISGHLTPGSVGDALYVAATQATDGTNKGQAIIDLIGTAGAGLTAVPWNPSWDAEVQSEAADALNAYDPPTKAELDSAVAPLATASALATTDGKVDALPSAADNAAATLTTQMTESYAANGSAPTLAQAQFAMHQMLMQFGISGTSITVKKLDNATTAFIVTLDDATNPTAAVRT